MRPLTGYVTPYPLISDLFKNSNSLVVVTEIIHRRLFGRVTTFLNQLYVENRARGNCASFCSGFARVGCCFNGNTEKLQSATQWFEKKAILWNYARRLLFTRSQWKFAGTLKGLVAIPVAQTCRRAPRLF
jgi:hypothetical protein